MARAAISTSGPSGLSADRSAGQLGPFGPGLSGRVVCRGQGGSRAWPQKGWNHTGVECPLPLPPSRLSSLPLSSLLSPSLSPSVSGTRGLQGKRGTVNGSRSVVAKEWNRGGSPNPGANRCECEWSSQRPRRRVGTSIGISGLRDRTARASSAPASCGLSICWSSAEWAPQQQR